MTIVLQASCVLSSPHGVLLVQESKPQVYGKWNLPGGHVESGEDILQAAHREVREETGLDVVADAILGIYTDISDRHVVHCIFHATCNTDRTLPGSDILACRWFAPDDIQTMDSELLLNPLKLRSIIQRYSDRNLYPVSLMQNIRHLA